MGFYQRIARLGLVAFLSTWAHHCVAANEFMQLAQQTTQPIGHYEFCQQWPDRCNIYHEDDSLITANKENWRRIVKVNRSVNARIKPATDMQIYGKEEYWTYPVDAGDCEDYALLKQRELHESGLPLSSLLLTMVRKRNGEGHVILTVHTNRGDFVLDNLHNRIIPWKKAKYHYVKRQSQYHTGSWIAIDTDYNIPVGSVQ